MRSWGAFASDTADLYRDTGDTCLIGIELYISECGLDLLAPAPGPGVAGLRTISSPLLGHRFPYGPPEPPAARCEHNLLEVDHVKKLCTLSLMIAQLPQIMPSLWSLPGGRAMPPRLILL